MYIIFEVSIFFTLKGFRMLKFQKHKLQVSIQKIARKHFRCPIITIQRKVSNKYFIIKAIYTDCCRSKRHSLLGYKLYIILLRILILLVINLLLNYQIK